MQESDLRGQQQSSCHAVFSGHRGSIKAVELSRDGLALYTAASDKEIRAWNIEAGTCIGVGTGHTANILCLALSRDGERLFSGSEDSSVREWATSTIVKPEKVCNNAQ